jgi:hypothetical protein
VRDSDLPSSVRRYLERAVPDGAGAPSLVRLTQEGTMRQSPRGRWLRFRAQEELSVASVAFTWRARFSLGPLLNLQIVDRYSAGEGMLEGRLWGRIPVLRSGGPVTAEGQALRYLAELFWVPHALCTNDELDWHEVDERTVDVSTRVRDTTVTARLGFDEAGDIVSAHAPSRPRLVGKQAIPTPWNGEVGDYAELGGVRVPTRAEVRWELPEGPFTYWRGTVTSLDAA